jgi:hypothetical protein
MIGSPNGGSLLHFHTVLKVNLLGTGLAEVDCAESDVIDNSVGGNDSPGPKFWVCLLAWAYGTMPLASAQARTRASPVRPCTSRLSSLC